MLLHMEVVGPMVRSLSGKKYFFMIIDDYSRYPWGLFLSHKSDTFEAFKSLANWFTIENNAPIMAIRSN